MKQIVIRGSENYTVLLTPRWTKEYFKRKGKEVHIYISDWALDGYDRDIRVFKLRNEGNNNFRDSHYFYISKENIGEVISDKQRGDNRLTNSYDLFENREDKVLIQIAKEINNEDIIKVIEIPDDVEYEVICSSNGFKESIIEKHRVWD